MKMDRMHESAATQWEECSKGKLMVLWFVINVHENAQCSPWKKKEKEWYISDLQH